MVLQSTYAAICIYQYTIRLFKASHVSGLPKRLPGHPDPLYFTSFRIKFMGRPELSKEEKRSERITLKLTKEEKKKIDKAAAICGLPPVVLVREKLFKGRFPEAKIPKVDMDTYVELKRIGVNINQQTRQLNAGKLPIGLLALLNKLKVQEEKIIRGLFYDSKSENR